MDQWQWGREAKGENARQEENLLDIGGITRL